MLRTFSFQREQVLHDFDITRANAWMAQHPYARLIQAVTHGVFNLTLIFLDDREVVKAQQHEADAL